jgi:hypothetical protein
MKRDQLVGNLIRLDCEAFPLPSLHAIKSETRRRWADATALLLARPRDPLATEQWLVEFIRSTRAQIAGRIAIGPTFVSLVNKLADDVLDALPTHTRHALAKLATLVAEAPVSLMQDERPLARALTVEGKFCEWLLGNDANQVKPKPDDFQKVRRELQQRYHPDKYDGDPAVAADINRLVNAAKRSA